MTEFLIVWASAATTWAVFATWRWSWVERSRKRWRKACYDALEGSVVWVDIEKADCK